VAVGRHGAQHGRGIERHVVQVDAVEVVARLLGGNGEAGGIDEGFQFLGRDFEGMGELACGEVGEVLRRQRLEHEARAPGHHRQAAFVRPLHQFELGAVGELAHDVIHHVGRHGGGAGLGDVGRNALDDLQVEVGGGQADGAGVGLNEDVGQDRNGVAALHDALHVVERLQERRALDDHTHSSPRFGRGAL
jgi:hypothetical protein